MPLSARQIVAVRALVDGRSLAATANAAGVNAATLYRWRTADPGFAAALKAAKDEAFTEGLEAVRRVMVKAAKVCEALMLPIQKPEVRLAAARAVLSVALRANEAVMIEERLAALERRLAK